MATSSIRTAVVMMVVLFMGMLVVSTQGQIAMAPAPTPEAFFPGMAPFESPTFNPTGAPTFISYAALSANRAPCPSGTGRSYYTPGCTAQPSATPYSRGCYQITRCARG
ncbi:hypothetical protein M758_1G130600 [Ceratodon purpureus]|uniref:Uncharacterized protein n=1 Tax=Ceratodon purpureus TaxID=3225 RepID=A0A8T0J4T1_CERPU|nr:hypothetical protein KC19_1G135800 [Ceratodon purpureus]KAG0629791.1 hypothetical protein M758_1G130600 [Ceratodon purpureus]